MRKGLLLLLCATVLAVSFGTAGATILGPKTVEQIQRGMPGGDVGGFAVNDTVGPVYGIVTAFDTFPSGFAFYLQNSQGGPWTGIDIFTGGDNTASSLGLAPGDSVCVEGALAEFSTFSSGSCVGGTANGETEILAKNGAFGGDIIITKISSGHALPPFHAGTVNEFRELCTNPGAEQWEGGLVEVVSEMRVVRTNFTGLNGGFRSALLVDNVACPPSTPMGSVCDSMYIDLSTLSFNAVDPGVPGQIVEFVRGVWNARSNGGRNRFQLQVRDGNDYGILAPPNLTRAYAIGDHKIRVIFDRDAVEIMSTTWELASFGSVDVVTQVNGSTFDLDVSGTGLSAGDTETITVTNIALAANPSSIATSAQAFSFRYGIVTPAMIQTADPDSLSQACRDVSQYLDTQLHTTFRGVCTAAFGNLYYIQGSTNPRDAISIFAPPSGLTVGHQYVIASSTTQEFFDETEMIGIVYVADEGMVGEPTPIVSDIFHLSNIEPCTPAFTGAADVESGGFEPAGVLYAEDFECMLVKVEQVQVTTETGVAPPGGFFDIAGPGPGYPDSMTVDNMGTQTYEPIFSDILDVTGVMHYTFGEFQIDPRDDDDIVFITNDVTSVVRNGVSFALAGNPARSPRVSFAIPSAANVELTVFDVTGRRVQTLARGHYAAGSYSEAWNGRDAAGSIVGAGVFFYRLTVDGTAYYLRGTKLN